VEMEREAYSRWSPLGIAAPHADACVERFAVIIGT